MSDTNKKESKEFERFEALTRKLVSVPKKEIQDQEKKKAPKRESRTKRS
jgi:hypothetical protein